MKQQALATALFAITTAFALQSAQASEETWRLTAIVVKADEGAPLPAFAQIGSEITVDYHFTDMVGSELPGNLYASLFDSVTINGETLHANESVVINWEGLKALNAALAEPNPLGLNFLSLNTFDINAPANSLIETLGLMSTHMGSTESEFRLDFGGPALGFSAWAAPTSLAPIPEPSTLTLMGIGIAGLMMKRRRQHRLTCQV